MMATPVEVAVDLPGKSVQGGHLGLPNLSRGALLGVRRHFSEFVTNFVQSFGKFPCKKRIDVGK